MHWRAGDPPGASACPCRWLRRDYVRGLAPELLTRWVFTDGSLQGQEGPHAGPLPGCCYTQSLDCSLPSFFPGDLGEAMWLTEQTLLAELLWDVPATCLQAETWDLCLLRRGPVVTLRPVASDVGQLTFLFLWRKGGKMSRRRQKYENIPTAL